MRPGDWVYLSFSARDAVGRNTLRFFDVYTTSQLSARCVATFGQAGDVTEVCSVSRRYFSGGPEKSFAVTGVSVGLLFKVAITDYVTANGLLAEGSVTAE